MLIARSFEKLTFSFYIFFKYLSLPILDFYLESFMEMNLWKLSIVYPYFNVIIGSLCEFIVISRSYIFVLALYS